MQSKLIKISQLKNNNGQIEGVPKNPRILKDDKYKKLVKSIQEDPEMLELREVIAYDNDGELVVIAGNMRLKACKEAGLDEVPTKILPKDTPADKLKRYTIKDNNSFGEWSYDDLANEWDADELDEWGLDTPDTWGEDKEVEEDEAPEVDESEPPKSKLGEIYQLGRHRIMCADSTVKDNVEKLMDGKKADMVFTDPPYRLETEGGKKGQIGKSLSSQGQSIDFISEFDTLTLLEVLPSVFSKSKFNAYIFCNKELLPEYLSWIVGQKLAFNVLVWKKPNAIPIGSDYRPDTEYIVFIRKNATWNTGIDGANYSRVLEYGRENGLHPTMKPVKLIANCLKLSSTRGNNILDLFLGSGSTLIACEQTDRTCFGMELSEAYVDVIRKRYHKFVTGSEEGWEDGTPAI